MSCGRDVNDMRSDTLATVQYQLLSATKVGGVRAEKRVGGMDERVFGPLIMIFAVFVSSVAVINICSIPEYTLHLFHWKSRAIYTRQTDAVPPEEGRASPAV